MASPGYMDPKTWPGNPAWWDDQAAKADAARAAEAQQPPDPMEIIRGLLDNMPDFGAEASSRVGAIYGPQYRALEEQQANLDRKARESDAQLKAMYNALAGGIKGDRGQITKNFGSATKGVNSAYAQGRSQIAGAYNQGNQELTDLFSQLGIQDAARDPRTLAANAQDSTLLQGLLSVNNQASNNALKEQQSSSLNFNTEAQGIAKSEGAQQRAMLQRSLQDKLAAFAQNRFNLDSQKAGALQDLQSQMENSWQTGQQKLAESAFSTWEDAQKAAAQAAMQQQGPEGPTQYQQFQMQGPVDRTYAQAGTLFGTQDNKASTAVALLSQLGSQQNYQNGFQFMEAALAANRQSQQPLPEDQLRSLAGFFWAQMKPGTVPTYTQ
jgi:hypothetical protein